MNFILFFVNFHVKTTSFDGGNNPSYLASLFPLCRSRLLVAGLLVAAIILFIQLIFEFISFIYLPINSIQFIFKFISYIYFPIQFLFKFISYIYFPILSDDSSAFQFNSFFK